MPDDATAAVPQDTGKLIGKALTRHHGMKRADLASLAPLHGASDAVMHTDIDGHAETITLENDVLFPRFEPAA